MAATCNRLFSEQNILLRPHQRLGEGGGEASVGITIQSPFAPLFPKQALVKNKEKVTLGV
jgi:hypothetical protein